MNIQEVKISTIKSNPNNPRLIKDDKFAKLVQSIRDFPEMLRLRPIVVNDDMIVLGGNMRLKACKEAGLKVVPIIKASDLTKDQQREFIIKDNVGFGEWDWEMLANEWDDAKLTDWGLDLPDMSEKVLEAEEDDFDVPHGGIETDIVPGDLFEIGPHRLLCGDSTDADAVARLMNGEKANALITDPPYGIGIANNPVRQKHAKSDWDDAPVDPSYFLLEVNQAIIWGGNYFPLPPGKGFFIWDKKQPEDFTLAMCEMAWTNIDTPAKMFRMSVTSYKKEHPTQKPVELLAWCINYTTGYILDPFLGSGSTMVAAHQLGRKCYGMELDPKYCQVIVDRMLKLDSGIEIKRNGIQYKR